MITRTGLVLVGVALVAPAAHASCGGAVLGTDHRFNRGEYHYRGTDRLFAEQARQYTAETGRPVRTDEDRALAAWYWRMTHFFHSGSGPLDYLSASRADARAGRGLQECNGYWTGLYGFGCGTCAPTHRQWSALLDRRIGHHRSRVCRVSGHAALEVFLEGGAYGAGLWASVDSDEMAVIFRGHPRTGDPADGPGNRLLGVREMQEMSLEEWMAVADCRPLPARQRGWYAFGQGDFGPHPTRGNPSRCYVGFQSVDYGAGYLEAPPTVHLRAGEKLRRYYTAGLGGTTYVFWGSNHGGKGPMHWQSWANQPEGCFDSGGPVKGRQIYAANAVFTYAPDFAGVGYREGVVSESDDHVTFEFHSPYVIGCAPAGGKDLNAPGATEGLVLSAGDPPRCTVQVSNSCHERAEWSEGVEFRDGTLDLTDLVKGQLTYYLRLNAGRQRLRGKGISIRTVCQANGAVVPRIDGAKRVTYCSLGRAVFAIHPNRAHAGQYVVEGGLGQREVVLEVPSVRGARILEVYAAGCLGSGSPPPRDLRSSIVASVDGGATYGHYLVKDAGFPVHQPHQAPEDYQSTSWVSGSADVSAARAKKVRVRFVSGRAWGNVHVWLVYEVPPAAAMKVTFDFGDSKQVSHVFRGRGDETWDVSRLAPPYGTVNNWVEMEPVAGGR